MRSITPFAELNPSAQTINLQEEKRIESEALALVELHDFIKAHPDAPTRDVARFMPPVDSRVVAKAIMMISIRDQSKTPEVKEAERKAADSIEAPHKQFKWGAK